MFHKAMKSQKGAIWLAALLAASGILSACGRSYPSSPTSTARNDTSAGDTKSTQKPTTLTGTYVPVAETTPAVQKLRENATNILDVTGAVAAHALVVECANDPSDHSISASTFSSAENMSLLADNTNVPKEAFQKYGLGPVTLGGKKYNVRIAAFGNSPNTSNADLQLDPINSQDPTNGRFLTGNTLVGGSIAIATAPGQFITFDFDHAVLQIKPSFGAPKTVLPSNATVTVNGKAYCEQGSGVPPEALINHILPGSLDFVSATAVNVQTMNGKQRAIYKVNGDQLLLTAKASVTLTIESDGCLEAPDGSKLCKLGDKTDKP